MEKFIEMITNKENICGDPDEPKEIEEWKGVKVEDGEVVEIDWEEFDLRGSLQLEWLPSSVRELLVSRIGLTGTLDWASLPASMQSLYLGGNAFTADPMDGHLYVVGRISTQSLGKPGATRYYWDPPGWHRVSAPCDLLC
ncbi:hypothetical protein XU18_3455 [Perkinsela sp. CCAP 1560/4]|nr:hypothetical protein XU18_3455 [Perkinsela sp. CCAP 1560/4]|eukprot:KNH05484.1 hypothetical protein XU18_3455 [Perkinsela sp. CCAP 1560/4]